MFALNKSEVEYITELLHECSGILSSFDRTKLQVFRKEDGTKVTNADIDINNYLVQKLQHNHPSVPILSEESDSLVFNDNLIASGAPFFCLDPIDGTHSFIKGTSEYVISLGVLDRGHCSHGWIAVPSTKTVYYRFQNKVFKRYDSRSVPVTLKKSEDVYIMPNANSNQVTTFNSEKFIFQSSALKFITLIEGMGRYFIQTHNTKLWDVVAGFALLDCFGLKAISSDDHRIVQLNSLDVPPFYVNNV